LDKEYKSVKLELTVYKKADYLKASILKPDGKKHSLSSIMDKGLDALIKERKEQ
jgi:hypothetical protein